MSDEAAEPLLLTVTKQGNSTCNGFPILLNEDQGSSGGIWS